MSRLAAVLVALLLAPLAVWSQADARSSADEIVPLLWRVGGDGSTVLLYGSIHIAPPEVLPPPVVVREAFSRASTLVTEVLIGGDLHLELATALTDRGVMPDGTHLSDLFSRHEWEAVIEWAREAGVPVSGLRDLQPWVVELLATELGATSSDLSAANGLDLYFSRKAQARGMRVLGLETIDDQIQALSGGSLDEQASSLLRTLDEAAHHDGISDLYEAWRTGDVDALARMIDPSSGALRAIEYERLFVQRNERWMATLSQLLSGDATIFVVVGAGHLVGPDGLPTLLAEAGHRVERITRVDELF